MAESLLLFSYNSTNVIWCRWRKIVGVVTNLTHSLQHRLWCHLSKTLCERNGTSLKIFIRNLHLCLKNLFYCFSKDLSSLECFVFTCGSMTSAGWNMCNIFLTIVHILTSSKVIGEVDGYSLDAIYQCKKSVGATHSAVCWGVMARRNIGCITYSPLAAMKSSWCLAMLAAWLSLACNRILGLLFCLGKLVSRSSWCFGKNA